MAKLDADNRKEIWIDIDGDEAADDVDEAAVPLLSHNSFTARGVKSAHVLRKFSHLFAENCKPETEVEAEALFNLSEALDTIDHFISHSWKAGRLLKWAALADFYHRRIATLLANTVWVVLSMAGCLWRSYREEVHYVNSFLIFTCFPCFLVCLFTVLGHQLAPWIGSKVFLDRVCIHQWDDELKAQGVRSLGDTLGASSQIIILWSSDYFHRLWCVFEIAVFSHSKHHTDMLFLPLWKSPMLYGLLLCSIGVTCFTAISEQGSIYITFIAALGQARGVAVYFALVHTVPAGFICYVIRTSIAQKLVMDRHVSRFTLANGNLSVETDREFIYGHIRKLFGSTDAFEEFVRGVVSHSVFEGTGDAWQLRYSFGAFAFQPYLWYLTSEALAMSDEGAQSMGCSGWKMYFVANVFFWGGIYILMPITLKGAAFSAHRTSTWPIVPGLVLDILIFITMVFIITYTCMAAYELCFFSTLDVSMVQPLNRDAL